MSRIQRIESQRRGLRRVAFAAQNVAVVDVRGSYTLRISLPRRSVLAAKQANRTSQRDVAEGFSRAARDARTARENPDALAPAFRDGLESAETVAEPKQKARWPKPPG